MSKPAHSNNPSPKNSKLGDRLPAARNMASGRGSGSSAFCHAHPKQRLDAGIPFPAVPRPVRSPVRGAGLPPLVALPKRLQAVKMRDEKPCDVLEYRRRFHCVVVFQGLRDLRLHYAQQRENLVALVPAFRRACHVQQLPESQRRAALLAAAPVQRPEILVHQVQAQGLPDGVLPGAARRKLFLQQLILDRGTCPFGTARPDPRRRSSTR